MKPRAKELEDNIRTLESQKEYLNSIIALCMAEANLIDAQIETYIKSGINVDNQLKDLRAELKDTV